MILIPFRSNIAETKTRNGRRVASLLLLGAAGLLAASLFFPMWHITLGAPQYPEGLGMYIWPSGIQGQSPNDLDIINELNHYIGMKKIAPDQIPELRIIPTLMMIFAGLSFLVAFFPRIWSVVVLLVAFAGTGILGMWDFWRWEYDYGHNLDPRAAINIPGMSYQPPLIGSAKLLNFTSQSWPALGACLMFASGALMAASLWIVWRRRFSFGKTIRRTISSLSLVSILILTGCDKAPVPLEYGNDTCQFCKMTLMQNAFGAERITSKGRVYKFDSIECLLESLENESARGDRLYVTDFSRPGSLVPAAATVYLRGGNLQSPMGKSLAAFASMDSARIYQGHLGGIILTFGDLVKS